MVSNVLGLEPDELVRRLEQLRVTHSDNPDYQKLRADLPEEWPI